MGAARVCSFRPMESSYAQSARYSSYGYGDSIDAINQQLDALESSRCPAPAPVAPAAPVAAPVAAAGGDAQDAEKWRKKHEMQSIVQGALIKKLEGMKVESEKKG